MRWLGGVRTAEQQAAAVRDRFMAWQEERGFTFWVVERKADGELLGFCGLKLADDPGSPVEGAARDRLAAARGLPGGRAMPRRRRAPRSISPSTGSGRERVVALTVEENAPSWGLMQRLGMTRRPDLDYAAAHWTDRAGDRLRNEARAMAKLITFGGKAPRIDPAAFVAPGRGADRRRRDRAGGEHLVQLRASRRRQPHPDRRPQQHPGRQRHPRRFAAAGRPEGGFPTIIGEDVLIGHMAMVHGCILHDRAFVGLGAIVMDGCEIESGAMLAAGALLAPGRRIPAGPALGRAARQICPRPERGGAGRPAGWESPIMSRWPGCTPPRSEADEALPEPPQPSAWASASAWISAVAARSRSRSPSPSVPALGAFHRQPVEVGERRRGPRPRRLEPGEGLLRLDPGIAPAPRRRRPPPPAPPGRAESNSAAPRPRRGGEAVDLGGQRRIVGLRRRLALVRVSA